MIGKSQREAEIPSSSQRSSSGFWKDSEAEHPSHVWKANLQLTSRKNLILKYKLDYASRISDTLVAT
jgi:hypothetical protein